MFSTIFFICHIFQLAPKRSTVVFVMIIFGVVVRYSRSVPFRSSREQCFQTKDTVWCINVSRLATNTVAWSECFSMSFSFSFLILFVRFWFLFGDLVLHFFNIHCFVFRIWKTELWVEDIENSQNEVCKYQIMFSGFMILGPTLPKSVPSYLN